MFQILKDLASGFAALFRFKERKQELENSPAQQANAAARTREQIRADATKAIANRADAEIRKGLADL